MSITLEQLGIKSDFQDGSLWRIDKSGAEDVVILTIKSVSGVSGEIKMGKRDLFDASKLFEGAWIIWNKETAKAKP